MDNTMYKMLKWTIPAFRWRLYPIFEMNGNYMTQKNLKAYIVATLTTHIGYALSLLLSVFSIGAAVLGTTSEVDSAAFITGLFFGTIVSVCCWAIFAQLLLNPYARTPLMILCFLGCIGEFIQNLGEGKLYINQTLIIAIALCFMPTVPKLLPEQKARYKMIKANCFARRKELRILPDPQTLANLQAPQYPNQGIPPQGYAQPYQNVPPQGYAQPYQSGSPYQNVPPYTNQNVPSQPYQGNAQGYTQPNANMGIPQATPFMKVQQPIQSPPPNYQALQNQQNNPPQPPIYRTDEGYATQYPQNTQPQNGYSAQGPYTEQTYGQPPNFPNDPYNQ